MLFKMSAICFNLDQSKILTSGNGLIDYCFLSISVVLPNDPYVYIGNNLTLHCNLTKYMYDTQYQSSKLMFLRKYDEVIPRKYISITSTRSIMLRYPITSPDDGGNYECKLNGSDRQRPVSIGNQHVYVECKDFYFLLDIACLVTELLL